MTRDLQSLEEVAGDFDAIVLDQWGVLHDGTRPYPGTVEALTRLKDAGHRLAVLSNSGKRAALNAGRIAGMGFDADLFDLVMTSGEALWRDGLAGELPGNAVFPISADPADEEAWGEGLDLTYVEDIPRADFVLLMGLPDFAGNDSFDELWFTTIGAEIKERGLTVFCTNPDRASPRAGGKVVKSPGAVAHQWADEGIDVKFYGKPHAPVFRAVERALGASPDKLLMVGDSLEHDIAGGHGAGWSTAFIRGGLHAATFQDATDMPAAVAALAEAEAAPLPTYTLQTLR